MGATYCLWHLARPLDDRGEVLYFTSELFACAPSKVYQWLGPRSDTKKLTCTFRSPSPISTEDWEGQKLRNLASISGHSRLWCPDFETKQYIWNLKHAFERPWWAYGALWVCGGRLIMSLVVKAHNDWRDRGREPQAAMPLSVTLCS